MEERVSARQGLPEGVVGEDQRLEAASESASGDLAKLRWHWTLDESNSERVGFAAYARAVGKAPTTIKQYAHGYVLFASSERGASLTIGEAVQRVNTNTEKQVVIEAVAEQYGTTPQTARRWHKAEVRAVKNAVEEKAEEMEEKGEDFPLEERAEYAQRIAGIKKRARDREQREREEAKKRHGARFFEADGYGRDAANSMKKMLAQVEGVEFDEEEVRLLQTHSQAVTAMARLVDAALTGDSGTDWDAELARIEQERDYE